MRTNQGFHNLKPEVHGPQHENVFQHRNLYLSGSRRAPRNPTSEYAVLENNEVLFPITFGCQEHLASFLMAYGVENTYLLHRLREGLWYHHLQITNGGVYRTHSRELVPLAANTNDYRIQRLHRIRMEGSWMIHTTEDDVDPNLY